MNLAELYFESLEGASNPSRFTPMNDIIRAAFKQSAGFDPKLLFDPASANAAGRDPASLRKFLDFRAHLVTEMQSQWMDTTMRIRERKPWLDIVLTHIDDRFEPGVRDALGADVAHTLPLAEARGVTLIIKDPSVALEPGRGTIHATGRQVCGADSEQISSKSCGRHQHRGTVSGCVSDEEADRC